MAELAPGAIDHVVPPSVETCHCTVGVGDPEAAAENDAVEFGATVSLEGWLVIVGAAEPPVTVRVAAFVVAFPKRLVKTALYLYPFWEVWAVKEYVGAVAPERLDHELPPVVETCHCTVGAGDPDADALNDADEPAETESFEGWLVILGREKPFAAWRFAGGVNLCWGKPTTRFV